MKNLISLLVLLFVVSNTSNAQNNPLLFTPNLSPDENTIAFNYQGDIWTCDINGENPTRITIHEGYDANPKWSNDGKSIAFQSNRFGNNDIFIIPSKGGNPKRITYHSSNDVITDFTSDGTILFNTVKEFAQVEREAEIHTVDAKGGTPYRLLNSLGFDATISPNKKFIAFTRGTCRIAREAYKGPANRDIWLYNIKDDSYHQLTIFDGQDFSPQWKDNQTLLFQSARSGKYNVHQLVINNNGKTPSTISNITSFNDMGIFSFHINKNGTTLVLNKADELFKMDLSSKKLTKVTIEINTDYRFDPLERKTFTSKATEIEVSPNGKLSAIVIRGEVFVTENDTKKSRTVNLSKSPYRDRDIIWLNDETLLFVSDRNGQNNIYKVISDDANEKDLFKSLKHKIVQLTNSKENEDSPVISPNGEKISFIRGGGKLLVADISSEGTVKNETILLNGWDTPSGIAWSPDSIWLSYSLSDLNFNEEVYIHKADNSTKPVNISMHPKSDRGPVWSKDGSKIGFSSNRNNSDYDVWFTWLTKKDWEKTKQDWEEDVTDSKKDTVSNKKDDKSKKEDVKETIIDFEDIYERQVQVTSFTGGEFLNTISKDGKTFYYTTGSGGRGNASIDSDLFEIKWDGEDKKSLTKGSTSPRNVRFNKKEDYIYYISKGKTSRIKVAGAKKESLPFSAKMILDYKGESNQIFEEAWAAINTRFYDPNNHGQNWDLLKKTYKPLAMKASTRDDFKYIFNTMLGQINASHMGMYRGENRADIQNERTGLLGIEVKPTSNGSVKIVSITPQMPADKTTSKLNVGDVITSVNGEKLTELTNFYRLINDTSNEKIVLGLEDKEVVIRPQSSNRTEKYKAWVKERKRLTNNYSNGKLGYIHIQGMNWTSFEHFERELTAAGLGKEGIVIDVRYNGGGWTTDYLMAVLNVKQHAYTIPRGAAKDLKKEHKKFKENYPFSERLPLASWTKPSIALCNESSYSNAEIFSHAYKSLGLGTLVGKATFGAVISTGGQTLIDGSYVRIPFRGWYVKNSEQNMDFTPAVPDIEIENAPDEKAKGKDTQLKRAVDELLKQI